MGVRLRIESDGTRKGTRLIAEGEKVSGEVENVAELEWYFDQNEEFVTAWVKLSEVGLTVEPDTKKETL